MKIVLIEIYNYDKYLSVIWDFFILTNYNSKIKINTKLKNMMININNYMYDIHIKTNYKTMFFRSLYKKVHLPTLQFNHY